MRSRSPAFFYIAFFFTGVATVLVSVLQPMLASAAGGGDGETGRMLAAQFSGQIVGAALIGRATRRVLSIGFLISLCGLTVLALGWVYPAPGLFFYGIGLGLTMGAVNVQLAMESSTAKRASRLEMLNVFWPLGAAACPWLLARAPATAATARSAFSGLAVVFGVLLTWYLVRGAVRGKDLGPAPQSAFPEEPAQRQAPALRLVSLAVLGFLVVGAESGTAYWLPAFSARYVHGVVHVAPLATLFWCSVLLSRLVAARLVTGTRFDAARRICAALAVVAAAAILLLRNQAALDLTVIVAGSSIGPLYPLVLAEVVQLRRKSLIFVAAGLGSACIPWSVGRLSTMSRSLREGLGVVMAACLLLLLWQEIDIRLMRHETAGH